MKKQMIGMMLCSMIFTGCSTVAETGNSSTQNGTAEVVSKADTPKSTTVKEDTEETKTDVTVSADPEASAKKETSSIQQSAQKAPTQSTTVSETSSSETKKPVSAPVAQNESVQLSAPATANTQTSSSAGKTETPAKQEVAHVHNWQQKFRTVHHDEVGHNETVIVSEAWDEITYAQEAHDVCNNCGLDFTTSGVSIDQHFKESFLYGDGKCGSYRQEWIQIPTGTVHHDAVTKTRYVVDQAAYDESVPDGYQCTGCGAIQK